MARTAWGVIRETLPWPRIGLFKQEQKVGKEGGVEAMLAAVGGGFSRRLWEPRLT